MSGTETGSKGGSGSDVRAQENATDLSEIYKGRSNGKIPSSKCDPVLKYLLDAINLHVAKGGWEKTFAVGKNDKGEYFISTNFSLGSEETQLSKEMNRIIKHAEKIAEKAGIEPGSIKTLKPRPSSITESEDNAHAEEIMMQDSDATYIIPSKRWCNDCVFLADLLGDVKTHEKIVARGKRSNKRSKEENELNKEKVIKAAIEALEKRGKTIEEKDIIALRAKYDQLFIDYGY